MHVNWRVSWHCNLDLLWPVVTVTVTSASWIYTAIEQVKVAQSCLTLCDPMDYTVHGILQARIREWVAFPFSRGSSQPRDWTQASRVAGRFFTSWATREVHIFSRFWLWVLGLLLWHSCSHRPGRAAELFHKTPLHKKYLPHFLLVIQSDVKNASYFGDRYSLGTNLFNSILNL